jgi:hypothetical protein
MAALRALQTVDLSARAFELTARQSTTWLAAFVGALVAVVA